MRSAIRFIVELTDETTIQKRELYSQQSVACIKMKENIFTGSTPREGKYIRNLVVLRFQRYQNERLFRRCLATLHCN